MTQKMDIAVLLSLISNSSAFKFCTLHFRGAPLQKKNNQTPTYTPEMSKRVARFLNDKNSIKLSISVQRRQTIIVRQKQDRSSSVNRQIPMKTRGSFSFIRIHFDHLLTKFKSACNSISCIGLQEIL